jgi:hypothetical protein
MGGGGHYAYNKHIWSPSGKLQVYIHLLVANLQGGFWSRPANWKSNTAVIATGLVLTTAFVWSASAEIETRDKQPTRWIPSMLWSKALKENSSLQEHS